jgi:hypothetical protein
MGVTDTVRHGRRDRHTDRSILTATAKRSFDTANDLFVAAAWSFASEIGVTDTVRES